MLEHLIQKHNLRRQYPSKLVPEAWPLWSDESTLHQVELSSTDF